MLHQMNFAGLNQNQQGKGNHDHVVSPPPWNVHAAASTKKSSSNVNIPVPSSSNNKQQQRRRSTITASSSSNSPMMKNTTAVSVSSSKLNVSRSSVESNELFSTTTSLAERFQKLNWILNDNAAGPLPPPWNQHQCANNASNLNSNCQYKEEFCFEWRRGECHRCEFSNIQFLTLHLICSNCDFVLMIEFTHLFILI